MKDKIKVLHLLNTGEYGGAQNVVISIINNMKEKEGFEFIYVSLDGKIREILKRENIKFEPIEKNCISEINRVIKKYNPQLIHAHDFTASITSSLVAKNIPLISHIHHNACWIKKVGVRSIVYLISSIKYKKILGVSKSIFDEYVFGKYILKKSIIISNPINNSLIVEKGEVKNKSEKYDIIFLGRMAYEKDPERFITIIEKVIKKFPYMKAAMIGSGDLERKCSEIIEEKGIANNIKMLGFIENPFPILKHSKVLCITSKWEGFGLVAIESLALGVPVLATKVGGLVEIINNDCGKLCENDDDFIKEIEKILLNSQYLMNKKRNAIKRASELENINQYIKEILEIYNDII